MPTVAAIIAGVALSLALAANAAPPALTPTPFVSGLAAPVEIAHANDGSGRLFVVEQAGRIRVIRNGAVLATPFLNLSAAAGGPVRTGGEQGLLGMAFHPHYASNGRFFVYYTRARAGDTNGNEIVLARYQRSAGNADLADAARGTTLRVIPHPDFGNHNGGRLAFGPDGYLYVAVGDGGGTPNLAQDTTTSLLGKVLRIDVDGPAGYSIPPTNPFAGSANPARMPEIWAYGLRNPWKLSFDRATGDLFIGDVGAGAWEEIDFAPRTAGGGRNYGWPVYEGTHCLNAATCSLAGHAPPVLEYPHNSTGGFSVTGGYRYRGTSLPALQGYYLYGDYVSGRIWAAEPGTSGTWTTTQVSTVANLSSFGEDEVGELYAANRDAGTIVRLTPAANPPPVGTAIVRYRLYNPHTRDHLYTTDANEYAVLPECCAWQPEGAVYRVLQGPGSRGGVDAVPLYRLYAPASLLHHWTTDRNEYDTLPAYGYVQEGIDGYVFLTPASGTVPLYRLYHPTGLHVWTTDMNERHTLQHAYGWIDEGISGYVLPI